MTIKTYRTSIADILEGIGKGLPTVMRDADRYDIALQKELAEAGEDQDLRSELDEANEFIRKIDDAARYPSKAPKHKRLDAVLELLEELN
jgi:hypothetical protein